MEREDMDYILKRSYGYEGLDHGAEANYSSAELLGVWRGSSRWPEFTTKAISKAEGFFEPALVIYDADFHESDGKPETLRKVTERFRNNIRAIFEQDFPRFSLRMLSPSYRKLRHEVEISMNVMSVAVSDGYMKRVWEAEAIK